MVHRKPPKPAPARRNLLADTTTGTLPGVDDSVEAPTFSADGEDAATVIDSRNLHTVVRTVGALLREREALLALAAALESGRFDARAAKRHAAQVRRVVTLVDALDPVD